MCFFELFASAAVMQVFITIFFELGEGEVTDNLYITSAFIFQALTFLLTMGMIMGIYHRKAKQLSSVKVKRLRHSHNNLLGKRFLVRRTNTANQNSSAGTIPA